MDTHDLRLTLAISTRDLSSFATNEGEKKLC